MASETTNLTQAHGTGWGQGGVLIYQVKKEGGWASSAGQQGRRCGSTPQAPLSGKTHRGTRDYIRRHPQTNDGGRLCGRPTKRGPRRRKDPAGRQGRRQLDPRGLEHHGQNWRQGGLKKEGQGTQRQRHAQDPPGKSREGHQQWSRWNHAQQVRRASQADRALARRGAGQPGKAHARGELVCRCSSCGSGKQRSSWVRCHKSSGQEAAHRGSVSLGR